MARTGYEKLCNQLVADGYMAYSPLGNTYRSEVEARSVVRRGTREYKVVHLTGDTEHPIWGDCYAVWVKKAFKRQ